MQTPSFCHQSFCLHLATCPNCAGSNYLSLQHVLVTPDGKGDVNTASTDLIENLIVPHWLVEKLSAPAETGEPPAEPLDAQQVEREQEPA